MQTQPKDVSKKYRWWPWLVGLGIVWGLLFVVIGVVVEPNPENWALMFSVWSAGAYTLGLRMTRRWWLPRLKKRPLRNAVLLGVFSAAIIETEFLIFEKIFGAQGIAASPNLIIDLLMTMPWYILMSVTFVQVQYRRRFSAATVLFLGAVYELGADGIVGPLMGVFSGDFRLFTLAYGAQMMLMFWVFIPVYSSMVLPPGWLIGTLPMPTETYSRPVWQDALRPMIWLFPFGVYLIVLMVVISAMTTS